MILTMYLVAGARKQLKDSLLAFLIKAGEKSKQIQKALKKNQFPGIYIYPHYV